MGDVIFRPVGPFARKDHVHAPAGDDKQIQFNDNGDWGATPKLTIDKDTGELDIDGSIKLLASTPPNTPTGGSVSIYVEETGITPNKIVRWKCKLENDEEVVLGTIIS
jgi:hypothetical protein